jgi:uncharacterized protein YecE (DUF72 family)
MQADLQNTIHPHIRAWGTHGIYFGSSSWTASEWRELLGRQRYAASEKGLLRALAAYANIFRTTAMTAEALGNLPPPVLARLGDAVPADFSFVIEVENGITTYRFPHRDPDRLRRGQRSTEFCDPSAFTKIVVPLLQHLGPRVHTVLFRFAPVFPTEEFSAQEFAERIDGFLNACPSQYRYAADIRTPKFVTPCLTECLRKHAAANVLHQEAGISLLEQILLPGALTADRSFLRIPADLSWLNGEEGLAVRETIRRCVDSHVELHIHLDPPVMPDTTIRACLHGITEMLTPDLARLSPIRRRVAA